MSRLLSPDEVISHLSVEVEKGGNNSKAITTLMRQVLDDGQWHEYRSTATGVVKTHGSFRDFIERGLGVKRIDLLVSWIEPVDKGVAGRLQRAWKEDIAPANPNGANQHTLEGESNSNPNNRTADGILRSLKRDHPDLAQQVIDGNITATAAARKAGYQTPVIRLGKITTVARKLREHYSPEEITELINHLGGESS